MATKQIKEFFAVTYGGVYHVQAKKCKDGIPIVSKIQSYRENKSIGLGDRLDGGSTVGIGTIGIQLYRQSKGRRMEDTNTMNWGGGTSKIIGLFLDRNKAMAIKRRKKPLKDCDPRWKKDTMAVLEAIGDNHPVFVISTLHELSIEATYEEKD
ncbi:hypothetical protein ACFL2U_02270 [Patescibacteria group bacterium]